MAFGTLVLRDANLLTAATTTGAGNGTKLNQNGRQTFQAIVSGTGAVGATVAIEVSDDTGGTGGFPRTGTWMTLATITLSGTTRTSDGFAEDAAWLFYRANLTAISGTGASVDVIMVSEV